MWLLTLVITEPKMTLCSIIPFEKKKLLVIVMKCHPKNLVNFSQIFVDGVMIYLSVLK